MLYEGQAASTGNSAGLSPFTQPTFVDLVKELFKSHLNAKSSVELICTLLEILLTITREQEWKALFGTQEETQDLLNFLVSLSPQPTGP